MGKNTLLRKAVREQAKENKSIENLDAQLVGNVGMVFTNGNLGEIRKIIEDFKVPAAARTGAIAPDDCFVQPGPTGLDPAQTSFFQSLNIATKIVKGAIEIINRVHLLKAGEKITASHVSLLSKLNIKPFFYKMNVLRVFEQGAVYSVDALDITDADLMTRFHNSVSKITALALAIGEPTASTIPHSFARAFQSLLALSVMTDIEFKEAKPFKEYLANPAAWAAKHGAPAAAPAAAAKAEPAKAEKKEEPKKEEPKKEEEEGGLFGGGLFD
jgi:large subunit ribosomal protein LP0